MSVHAKERVFVTKETAYCMTCGSLHWIKDVIADTATPASSKTPEGTRLRRVRLDCHHVATVISREVSGR